MKVRIEDMYDGFNVIVFNDEDVEVERAHIDQEDSRLELARAFKALGAEVEYEEVY